MVGLDNRGDNPGDLWQIARGRVCDEVGGELRTEGVLIERGRWVLKAFEKGKDVVRGEDAVAEADTATEIVATGPLDKVLKESGLASSMREQ